MKQTRTTPNEYGARFRSLLVEIEEALMNASICLEPASSRSFAQANQLVAELLAVAPDEAESHYVAGLAMYETGIEGEEEGRQAERHFLKALSIEPNHQFARLYLGHNYFDNGNYAQALAAFEQKPMFPVEHFSKTSGKLRLPKSGEIIIDREPHPDLVVLAVAALAARC